MITILKAAGAIGLLAAFSGCASVPRDAGFDDVQASVDQRIGQRMQWRQETPEDGAATQAVQNMLKQELGAEQAVQIALLNNRRLQATYETLGVARANLVQAGLLRNPVFNAEVLFRSAGAPNLTFGIAQDFLSVFYLPLRKRIAGADFEAAKLTVTSAVLELAGEVKNTFFRLQAAEQTVDMLKQAVLARAASFDAARRLSEAGNITDLALHQEQALYEETRLLLSEAEGEAVGERERLNSLMGVWGEDTQWRVDSRLPELPEQAADLTNVEQRAIAASFELGATQAQLQSAGSALGFANVTALLPSLQAGVAYERDDGESRLGPSLNVPIPIFDFGQGRLATARSAFRRVQQDYAAQAVEIRSAARTAALSLANARARSLYVWNTVLPTRSRVVKETQLQYNAGQVGVFELLLAEERLLNAGRQYIDTLREYWLANDELELLLAGGTSNSLSRTGDNRQQARPTQLPGESGSRLTGQGSF